MLMLLRRLRSTFCISLVLNSLGTAVVPRRNEKQMLCKILGDKQGVFMGDVQWRIAFLSALSYLIVDVHLLETDASLINRQEG